MLPLVGNYEEDEFRYEVHVYTGVHSQSGTDSRVRFIIAGTEAYTTARLLSDGVRKNFKTGDVSAFLLRTQYDLGVPVNIRVWHDNSGEGRKAGWFLSKIVIVDLQNKQWYLFKCDKWLALDEDDGRIERVLRVTSEDDPPSSDTLLSSNVSKSFWNDHLWLSIGYRKSRSGFTRVQRLSCCLAILFLTMVTNAMFYGTGSDDTAQSAFTIGPFSVTIQQLYTSIASSVIIVPPIIVITAFFSKSALKKNEQKHESQQKQPSDASSSQSDASGSQSDASGSQSNASGSQSDGKRSNHAKKLPYWCNYIAWLLVALCIACGAFFTILYALQWGKKKSEAWLLTFVLSFGQSLLVIQPLKVRFLTNHCRYYNR